MFDVGTGVVGHEGNPSALLGVDGFEVLNTLDDCDDVGLSVPVNALFERCRVGDVAAFACSVETRDRQDGI